MSQAMLLWRTQLTCVGKTLGTVKIKCGIFQGDSFSPLLFIICLLPLTMILRNCSAGCHLGDDHMVINHLLYLDDLKSYGRNQREIQSLVNTVGMFSDHICMKFGLDKCASLSVKRGVVQSVATTYLNAITAMDDGSVYKYLGILEKKVFDAIQMKSIMQKEFLKRSKTVLQSQINSGNKVKGINMFAVPVIRYAAGLVN